MGKSTQTVTQAKAAIIQADTAAADKSIAISQIKAVVVPIKRSLADIRFPGGTVAAADHERPMTVTIDPETGGRTLGGSDWPPFSETLLEAVLATIRTSTNDPKATSTRIAAAAAALAAFKPVDEVEAMLSAQAVAMHSMGLECFRRAMLPDQHPDIASKLRKDGANLCRGMVDMLDGLDRRRGKVSQVVRVERVVVHEGGQAIVGNVQPAAPKAREGQG